MDGKRFDLLARALSSGSRRDMFKGLAGAIAGGLLVSVGPVDAAARRCESDLECQVGAECRRGECRCKVATPRKCGNVCVSFDSVFDCGQCDNDCTDRQDGKIACASGKCCKPDNVCVGGGTRSCCLDGATCDTTNGSCNCPENTRRCGQSCCPQGRKCCDHVCCREGVTGCDQRTGKCRRLQATVTIPAGQAWTATGLTLDPGDEVSVSATGSLNYCGGASQCNAGPNGSGETHCGAPAGNCGALLGRIGGGTAFRVGASLTFTAEAGGALELGIQDFQFDDNTGGFEATLRV